MFTLIACIFYVCYGQSVSAITLNTSSERLTVGADFIFTCHPGTIPDALAFTSNGKPVCTMFRNDVGSCSFANCNKKLNYTCNPTTLVYTLTIPGSLRNDSYHNSKWICQDLSGGGLSNEVQLFINVPISEVLIEPPSADVAIGNTQTFTCTTNPGRPTARIQWYLSDGTTKSNLTSLASQEPECYAECSQLVSSKSTVVYSGNLDDHQKIIYCIASNFEGKSAKSDNSSIDILYGPNEVIITPSDKSYTIDEGGSVEEITCSADCRPNCTMTWSGPNISVSSHVLYLQNIDRNQAGDYWCNASNTVGSIVSSIINILVHYGPLKVNFYPTDNSYTIVEGESIGSITCTADCRPSCTITWTGPNIPGGTTSVLNLQNINRNQTGDYQCRANNTIGSPQLGFIDVTVMYGPSHVEFFPSIKNYTVKEDTSVGPINCTADCRPNCSYTWKGPRLPSEVMSVLKLEKIDRLQAGIYWCNASNNIDTRVSAEIGISVQYGPRAIILSPTNVSYTVTEGGSIGSITCTADCKPKCVMTWSGPTVTGGTSSVLNLRNITRNQTGIYQCTARSIISSSKFSTVNVTVLYGPNHVAILPLTHSYKPIEKNGSVGPINCTADCRPACVMKWNGPSLQSAVTSVLNLHNIDRNQTGNYSCTAENSVGMDVSFVVSIIVQYLPSVMNIDGNVTYKENETLRLNCKVDGVPQPSVSWAFYDGVSKKPLKSDHSNNKTNELVLSKIGCLSMGTYTCEAKNMLGMAAKPLDITVNCSPRMNELEYNVSYTIAVLENEPLNISSHILAFPQPKVLWQLLRNDSTKNISNIEVQNLHFFNRHISNILVSNMTPEDFGIYNIHASNGIGVDNRIIGSYDVTAARRPDKPTNVTCSSVSKTSIALNWEPAFNGGRLQTFSIFFKKHTDSYFTMFAEGIMETNYRSIEVTSLTSSTRYLLKIKAENMFNSTESDTVQCNTTEEVIPKSESLLAVGAGVGVGAAFLIICIVGIVFFLRRRYDHNKAVTDKQLIQKGQTSEDEKDELKDNPLYVSSVDDFMTLDGAKGGQGSFVKQGSKQKKKKHRKEVDNNPMEMGCVYENHDFLEIKGSQIHENGNCKTSNDNEYKPKMNKDGLIYADLDLAPISAERRFVIRGIENKSIYAAIDLTQTAEPLPLDDEDDKDNLEDINK